MKLLKRLGKKPYTKKSGEVISAHLGLFECPVCLTSVTKPVSQGLRNKTCGNSACRKAALSYNPKSAPNPKSNPLYKRVFVRAIQEQYRMLCKDTTITEFNNTEEFYDYVIQDYTNMHKTYRKIRMCLTDNTKGVARGNIEIHSIKDRIRHSLTAHANEMRRNCKYSSLTLAEEFGYSNSKVSRVAKTVVPIELPYVVTTIASTSYKELLLTESQYNSIKAVLKYNSTKATSSNIYLLESLGYYKIGIASDVDKRLQKLRASSPADVTLVTRNEVPNARVLEKYLHKKYSNKNHKFEWFSLSKKDVSDVINSITSGIVPIEEFKASKVVVKDNHVSKPEIVTTCSSIIPEEHKVIANKTKHPMYNSWRTVMNRKAKGFTTEPTWDNFDTFVTDMEEMFNSCDNPMLESLTGDYTKGTCTFVGRRDFSSNAKQVVGIPWDLKNDKANGNEIIFKSAKDAAMETGSIAAHITACCKGRRTSHNNYKWKYPNN